jgi:hypothetical protein
MDDFKVEPMVHEPNYSAPKLVRKVLKGMVPVLIAAGMLNSCIGAVVGLPAITPTPVVTPMITIGMPAISPVELWVKDQSGNRIQGIKVVIGSERTQDYYGTFYTDVEGKVSVNLNSTVKIELSDVDGVENGGYFRSKIVELGFSYGIKAYSISLDEG